jgi:hypothetical protein
MRGTAIDGVWNLGTIGVAGIVPAKVASIVDNTPPGTGGESMANAGPSCNPISAIPRVVPEEL